MRIDRRAAEVKLDCIGQNDNMRTAPRVTADRELDGSTPELWLAAYLDQRGKAFRG